MILYSRYGLLWNEADGGHHDDSMKVHFTSIRQCLLRPRRLKGDQVPGPGVMGDGYRPSFVAWLIEPGYTPGYTACDGVLLGWYGRMCPYVRRTSRPAKFWMRRWRIARCSLWQARADDPISGCYTQCAEAFEKASYWSIEYIKLA